MNRVLRLVAIASVAFLLAGCPAKSPPPNPSLTRGGSSGPSPDFVLPSDVYGDDASGLGFRGADAGMGTRIDNILDDVYFDYDTSYVKESERPKLIAAADHLRNNPGDRLIVEGNADWRGTSEYNLALGDRRANSVKTYLLQLGVDAARIDTVSHGDLNAEENAAESQMAMDRRADLVILR